MIGGLVKQQDQLDKMSGAQDAKPQVVVNIGYDPIDQFRQVVQEELRTIDIEAETIEDDNDDEWLRNNALRIDLFENRIWTDFV